jgi:hypothetical protein
VCPCALVVMALMAMATPARAQPLQCRSLRGPCTFLDTLDVLLGPGEAPPVLVANFGLVAADGSGGLRFACEPGLGALAARARIAPGGEIFVGGDGGLLRYQPACGSRVAGGALVGQAVLDAAFDPQRPARIWALGLAPRAVYISTDGGARFGRGWEFAGGEGVLRLRPAPSRPDTLYGAGDAPRGAGLLIARSDDGGATFARVSGTPPPGLPLDLLGVDPADPEVLLVALRSDDGADGVWRSSDGGRSWTRSLTLPAGEVLGGFTFTGRRGEVLVAGRAQLYDPALAPAHLFASDDGGVTFGPGLASGASGPRYRCLGYRGGQLYACGGGAVNDDAFLLGSSSDGGKSWTSLMTTQGLRGPEPCLGAACAATGAWLCDTYGLCEGGGDPGTPPARAGGCQCAAGGGGQTAMGWLLALVVARLRRSALRAPGKGARTTYNGRR